MKYAYYPGCSLRGANAAYEKSFLAVCEALGVELEEVEDWNCCGATAYMSVDDTQSMKLAGRNLAIASRMGAEQLVAPCSGCFLTLKKSQHRMKEYPEKGELVRRALDSVGLSLNGGPEVRHALDILMSDVGLDKIRQKVTHPLKGLVVAPYYGCQIVRPYADFDAQQNPVMMDNLFNALGAKVCEYPLKTRCCGGHLTGTMDEPGKRLSFILLREAKRRGANCLATVCPLCHFNLDSYQDEVANRFHEDVTLPCVYFTQLIGLAFGMSAAEVGLNRNIVEDGGLFTEKAFAVAAPPAR